jgi:nickel superoxide dismutase
MNKLMNYKILVLLMILSLGNVAPDASAHCEIPCGIYGDAMRFDMIDENCQTVEKSMTKIISLSLEGEGNYNQLVRWVNNKEVHANNIQAIVTQYFMFQRIKPVMTDNAEDREAYKNKLVLLHKMLVHAMKCKQTTDISHVKKIRELLDSFRMAYFGEKAIAHLDEHHSLVPSP